MSVEANKAAVREFFSAIDRAQNMAAVDAIADPSYVAHFPGAPPMNREGVKGFGDGFFQACPGLTHSVETLIGEDDTVAVQLTIRGSHTRPFVTPAGAIPPSGKAFELPVLNLYRFSNGRVVE